MFCEEENPEDGLDGRTVADFMRRRVAYIEVLKQKGRIRFLTRMQKRSGPYRREGKKEPSCCFRQGIKMPAALQMDGSADSSVCLRRKEGARIRGRLPVCIKNPL